MGTSSILSKPSERKRVQENIRNINQNSQTAMLCPKRAGDNHSASFLLGGDTNGRLRYWNIEDKHHTCKHFYLAEGEKLQYKKGKHRNTFHTMKDKVVQLEDQEESKNSSDLLPKLPGVHEGHCSSITALGMLYKEEMDDENEGIYAISSSTDGTIKIWK